MFRDDAWSWITTSTAGTKVYAAGLQLLEELLLAFALRNFDLEVMEFESAHSNTTAKLPILKLGEYEMWVIRIKQYFQVQDYALWEVIENGNSWVSVPQTAQENGTSVTKMSVPVTAEEKTNKKNDVKARSLLLMALPNEHQLTFSQYNDTKTMLQKIVSRLAILGVVITQEDLNSKFLTSLAPEWNTHVVVWMNKTEIETMSIGDLYNNFKIVEQSVKKSVGASSGAQNLAFMTAPSTSISTASFSDNAVYAFMVENPNGSNLIQQDLEKIHEDDLEAMDLKWDTLPGSVEHQGTRRVSSGSMETMKTHLQRNVGYRWCRFDWSDIAEEQVQTNMALMAFLDSEVVTPRQGGNARHDSKENSDDSLVKEQVSKDTSSFVESSLNVDKETVFLDKKIEFVKPKNHEKPVKKSVRLIVNTIKGKGWYMGIIITGETTTIPTTDSHPNTQRNMVPRAVLMKIGLKPFNTARTVNTAHPKSTVFSAKPMSHFSKSAQSTGKPQQDDT
ncbi:hypothetical protein Tco_0566939 [Tanacetum coccineum]